MVFMSYALSSQWPHTKHAFYGKLVAKRIEMTLASCDIPMITPCESLSQEGENAVTICVCSAHEVISITNLCAVDVQTAKLSKTKHE